MEKCAPRWNGVGYVQVEYDGKINMSDPVMEAAFIIKYMHQDKPGTKIVLQFRYEDDIDKFYEMLNSSDAFKQMPSCLYERENNTELYGEGIESIECRQARTKKPIEIVKMKPAYNSEINCETVTVYARRITPEEMLKYMPSDVIKFNAMTNDRYKISNIPGYLDRLNTVETWVAVSGGRYNRETGEFVETETAE